MKNGFAQIEGGLAVGGSAVGDQRGLTEVIGTLLALARRRLHATRPGSTASESSATAPEHEDAERLRDAFDAFGRAANRLESSYAELRSQVEELSAQLAHANGQLERQLEEKRSLAERQSALLAALPAGVVVVGPCGTVRDANAAAERLLGRPLVGQSWTEASAKLAPAECDFEWFTSGAERRRVGLEEQSMGTDRERIVLLHDVTDAHVARERLARNERLAAMGEMAARIAHQLRTPLATAMLYASQLERAGLNAVERESIAQRVLSRLRSLERVTRDMLCFVRGERVSETAIDIGTLLGESAQVMEPLMAARGIAFTWEDRTGGAVLRGDRRGLAAAMLSLLENAVQATRQGGKVRLEGMANSVRVRISVTDTGSGIDAAALPRLFEPFYSTRSDGTGLGLAIVKSVVEAHGGTIDVVSDAASGTRFTIELPRALGGAPMALQPPVAAARGAAQERYAQPDAGAPRIEREAA